MRIYKETTFKCRLFNYLYFKKSLKKSPARKSKFKELYPHLNLPPEPIITRWGTWINLACYICDNFEAQEDIFNQFNKGDSIAVENTQEAFQNPLTKQETIYISTNMDFVLKALKDLHQKDISLFNRLEIFSQVTTNVNKLPFDLGNTIKERYEYIIDKNIGLGLKRNLFETREFI